MPFPWRENSVIDFGRRCWQPPRGALMVGLFLVVAGGAGNAEAEQQLLASLRAHASGFGSAVALSGDILVVGQPGYEGGFEATEAPTHVYRRIASRWVEVQTIEDPDGFAVGFGKSVATSGDVIVVGNGLSATVYRWGGSSFGLEQTLAPAAPSGPVAISGDTIVLGAKGDAPGGLADAGSASVFRWDGASWVEEQTLVASDAASGAEFGAAVGISGDSIVIGAHGGAGALYLYRWNGTSWVEEQKIPGPGGSGRLGEAVAIDGAVIVAGSGTDDFDTGPVRIYRWDGVSWNEEQAIPPDAFFFGRSVAVSGDLVVVGSRRNLILAGGTIEVGAARVYRRDGLAWVDEYALTASDAGTFDEFGAAVAISDGLVAVAAPADRPGSVTLGLTPNIFTGSVSTYAFRCESGECFVDSPVDADSILLRRGASGLEKLSLVTRDAALPVPLAANLTPVATGMTVEFFSENEGVASIAVPTGPGWKVEAEPGKFGYVFRSSAQGGPSDLSRVALRARRVSPSTRSLKLSGKTVPLSLGGPQASLGIRITFGHDRICALFPAGSIQADGPSLFRARGASANDLSDCTDATMMP
jgi:hypothetical protein